MSTTPIEEKDEFTIAWEEFQDVNRRPYPPENDTPEAIEAAKQLRLSNLDKAKLKVMDAMGPDPAIEYCKREARIRAEKKRKEEALRNPPPEPEPVYTKRGTRLSPKWSDEWIEDVKRTEDELDRRCCGAHAPDGEPCILQSTHENGRCRFHGGAKNIGAPLGNSNARIHGLYMRRVQQCGTHCAQWKTCPMAAKDVLDMPEAKRPLCAYESEELKVLRRIDQSIQAVDEPLADPGWHPVAKTLHPMRAQLMMLRENLHLLQIMITRAAKAIQAKGLVTETEMESENYTAKYEKPSAILQAFQILNREHRQTLNIYRHIIDKWGLHTHTNILT